MVPREDRSAVLRQAALLRSGFKGEPIEHRIVRKDGSVHWVKDTPVAALDGLGDIKGYDGIIQDITELKAAETALEASRASEELLLKNLRQRMNNILAIIVSLLDLEAGKLDDAKAYEFARTTRFRVCALSTVFDLISSSKAPEDIRFDTYVERLARSILDMEAVTEAPYKLELELEPVTLDAGRAIPLGLILTEVLSDSMRHGFPGDERGPIRIALAVAGGKVGLEVVADFGGAFLGADDSPQPGTGLALVKILAQQVGARPIFTGKDRARARFEFDVATKGTKAPSAPSIDLSGSDR